MAASSGARLHEQFELAQGSTTELPFTSTNVVRFSSQTALQIRTDLVSNGDNVLAEVYATDYQSFGSVATATTDLDARSRPLATKSVAAPRFYLTDDTGTPVNLNGQTMAFTIMIYDSLDHRARDFMALVGLDIQDSPLPYIYGLLREMVALAREAKQ
jgi:hypothetical protein